MVSQRKIQIERKAFRDFKQYSKPFGNCSEQINTYHKHISIYE